VLYEFKNSSGEVVARHYPAGKAPDIGRVITVNGESLTRVYSVGVTSLLDYDHDGYPKISKALPQFAPGADHVGDPGKDYGCAVIKSRRHQDEMCRRHGFTREYHHNDPQTAY